MRVINQIKDIIEPGEQVEACKDPAELVVLIET